MTDYVNRFVEAALYAESLRQFDENFKMQALACKMAGFDEAKARTIAYQGMMQNGKPELLPFCYRVIAETYQEPKRHWWQVRRTK